MQRLEAKVEAFRTRKETIKATYTAAEAETHINEAVTGISEEMGDVGMAMQRAQDKTEQLQARAGALDELIASGALEDATLPAGRDDIQAQLEAATAGSDVEEELARMKEQLPAAAAPPPRRPSAPPAPPPSPRHRPRRRTRRDRAYPRRGPVRYCRRAPGRAEPARPSCSPPPRPATRPPSRPRCRPCRMPHAAMVRQCQRTRWLPPNWCCPPRTPARTRYARCRR
jgi:hypothetical protein